MRPFSVPGRLWGIWYEFSWRRVCSFASFWHQQLIKYNLLSLKIVYLLTWGQALFGRRKMRIFCHRINNIICPIEQSVNEKNRQSEWPHWPSHNLCATARTADTFQPFSSLAVLFYICQNCFRRRRHRRRRRCPRCQRLFGQSLGLAHVVPFLCNVRTQNIYRGHVFFTCTTQSMYCIKI